MYTSDQIGHRLIHLDLKCEPISMLKQLAGNDHDDIIACQVMLMVQKMKKLFIPKDLPIRTVNVCNMFYQEDQTKWLKMDVNTSHTVAQLKDQIQLRRQVRDQL